jgi:hypothetical protein
MFSASGSPVGRTSGPKSSCWWTPTGHIHLLSGLGSADNASWHRRAHHSIVAVVDAQVSIPPLSHVASTSEDDRTW